MKLDRSQETKFGINTALIIAGVSGFIYGGWGGVYFLWSALAGTHSLQRMIPAVILYGGFSLAAAGLSIWKIKERAATVRLIQEQSILNYAATQPGRSLTLSDIVTHSGLTLGDTKKVLERMISLGVCEMNVSEQGKVSYAFVDWVDLPMIQIHSSEPALETSSLKIPTPAEQEKPPEAAQMSE
jgi:hypothetical protein